MSNHTFQFKQFSVAQNQCAMKVSLDACLLGARCETADADTILDIGTGTGLLALMLAQKSTAKIDAIEIDQAAATQAQENVMTSPFKSQIQIHNKSIQSFQNTAQPNSYDLIICNPPFFSGHLSSHDPQRNLARHNNSLSFNELSLSIAYLLKTTGNAWLLLPPQEHKRFLLEANHTDLNLTKCIDIYSRKNKPSKLAIWVYSKRKDIDKTSEEILIYHENSNQYSHEFCKLLADYYLIL